jgi:carbonic anhydrase/acetyltransferase-like protein (isoleucine patch superfamily)
MINNILIVDSTAYVDPTVEYQSTMEGSDVLDNTDIYTIIGYRARIGPRTRIEVGTRIGAFTSIGSDSVIGFGSDIGNCVSIGNEAGVGRCATIGHHTIIEDIAWVSSDAIVGPYCHIGLGSHIGPGARLGEAVWTGERVAIYGGQVVPDHWRLRHHVSGFSHLGIHLYTGIHPDENNTVRLMKRIDPTGIDPDNLSHRFVEGGSGKDNGAGFRFYSPRLMGEWCRRDGAAHIVSVRVHVDTMWEMRRDHINVSAYDDARIFYLRT